MKKIVLMLLIIFTLGSPSLGATIRQLPNIRFEEDIDFNETKLTDALALISKIAPVTIVADSEIKDRTIDLYISRGQALREVLDIIKVTNDLGEVYIGNVIMLANQGKGSTTLIGKAIGEQNQGISNVKVTLGDGEYESVETMDGGVFIFEGLRPGVYMIKLEKEGHSPTAEIVDIKANQITNIDINIDKENKEGIVEVRTNENIRDKEFGTSKNETGMQELTERIQLKHGTADDIQGVIESILGDKIKVTSFPKLHMLVLKGATEDVNIAKNLIDDLDRAVKQVRITVQILDTTDNLLEDLGFDWLFSNLPSDITGSEEGGNIGILPVNSIGGVGSNFINFLDIFNDGKNLLSLSINMLQKTDDLSISSVPSVVIINGETADFKVTEEIIVGTIVEEDDDGNRTEEPLFEEAGTIFQVTPTIREGVGESDTIMLDVSSEVSDFKLNSGYAEDSGAKLLSNISTKIQVKDKDVVFIGGLKKTTVQKTESKLPILGDIPFLGTLFRSTSTTNDIRQIYIQITAEIVNDENKNDELDLDKFRKNPGNTGQMEKIYPMFKKAL